MNQLVPKICILFIFLTSLLISGCIHNPDLPELTLPYKEDSSDIVITGATFFNGNPAEKIQKDVNILIQNGKITHITRDEISSKNARHIDARGKSVIPGLFDAHVHTVGSGAPPHIIAIPDHERVTTSFLYSGITSVTDMGAPVEDMQEMAEKIRTKKIVGPRLIYAGKIFTHSGSHPTALIRKSAPWPIREIAASSLTNEIDEDTPEAELRSLIKENKEHGAAFTKIVIDQIPLKTPFLKAGQVRKIVTISQQEGLHTLSHIGSEEDILIGLEGGVRFFIHGPYRSMLSDSTIQKLKESNAIVIPTVAVFDNIVRYYQNSLELSDLDKQVGDPNLVAEYLKPFPEEEFDEELIGWLEEAERYQDIKFQNVAKLKQAGITLLAGSDSSNVASMPGPTLHRELELLISRCGFSVEEAIASATFIPGKIYAEISGSERIGYLAEGYPADLLVLDGDIASDIRVTQKISHIFLAGREVQRFTE